MPLVEVIRGAKTSDVTVVTVSSLARKLGKTVVVCNDGPGFVVNRVLGPYMNESGFLLEEGNTIESIDGAMIEFGMPMGPMALLDEVGIDVAAKVAGILRERFAGRIHYLPGIQGDTVADTAQLIYDGKTIELPVVTGTMGEKGIDIANLENKVQTQGRGSG